MSGKVDGLGYDKKDMGRCRSCRQMIMWGYRFGKKHPYDVVFDDEGIPHKTSSHFDTCPAASAWRPASRSIRVFGDLNTEQIEKWRASCACPETYPTIDWKTVVLFEVPERHAWPIAQKLVALGGSHSSCHPGALFESFEQIAVRDQKVTAVLLRPAFYNEIHQHLYGSWLSVFGDMSDRKPVSVAGYRLEPSVVLQGCNLAESQDCT